MPKAKGVAFIRFYVYNCTVFNVGYNAAVGVAVAADGGAVSS
jgi:hypothetical protein